MLQFYLATVNPSSFAANSNGPILTNLMRKLFFKHVHDYACFA